MDRIIEVKVGGNHLSKDNKNAGVKGEANVTRLRITFDESWDSYAKTVTFWDALGKNPVKRTLTTNYLENIVESTRIYLVPIPAEPMAEAGTLTFVIDGYISGKRQRSMSDVLVVKDAPITDNAGEPADPTPTQAEQLQVQIDKIMDDIQDAVEAKNLAEAAHIAAELSVEKASQASTSEANARNYATKAEEAVGKTSYIGENGNWYAWDSLRCEFYDTGIKAQSGSTVYVGANPPSDAEVWINPIGDGNTIDLVYNSLSENAQSGKAVSDALTSYALKADSLMGYNIQDAYTKTDVDNITNSLYDELDVTKADKTEIPTKLSELVNDSDLIDRATMNGMATFVYDKLYEEKADKTTIETSTNTDATFEFSNTYNTEIRLAEVITGTTSISFTFGDGEYSDTYTSGLSFYSGETPTAIDYTDSGILNWVGTDCTTSDGLSIFQPSANTHYDIVFYFNGMQFIGLVNGYVSSIGWQGALPTGNVVSA